MCKAHETLATLATPGFGEAFDNDVETLRHHNVGFTYAREGLKNIRVCRPHLWWTHVTSAFKLHPVIKTIVMQYNVCPQDWHLLMLEWPHVSVDDDSQLAYTRTEIAGQDFSENGSARQTKTSIGKYVARHWPHVPDHIRRDWVGTFSPSNFEIWEGTENIIAGIELGPQSCMKSSYEGIPFSRHDNERLLAYRAGTRPKEDVYWESHPYAVYQPQYGWAMAVRLDKGKPDIVMGRALVQLGDKKFVRSYKRGDSDSDYSHTDEKLEHWLTSQGFSKTHGWEGYKFAKIEHPDSGYTAPYLDGNVQRAVDMGSHFCIDDDGDYQCDNTDGTITYNEDDRDAIGDCDRCGCTVYEDEDDRLWAGIDEDTLVCGNCARHYTYVTGAGDSRHGRRDVEYYVRDNRAVSVDGNEYDKDNLPSYIYALADGSHAHEDNCVLCIDDEYRLLDATVCDEDGDYHEVGSDDIVKISDCYYKKDSDDIVQPEDDPDKWHAKADCWESVSGKWFTDEQPQIELEGTYAASELQDMIDNA